MEKRAIRSAVLGVLVIFLVSAASQAAPPAGTGVSVSVVTDRPDAIYRTEEKATFAIEIKRDGKSVGGGSVTYALSLDGAGNLGRGKLELSEGRASVSGSLDKPGILRCTVRFAGGPKQRAVGMAGAVFDPFKIKPTATVPADFDEFWNAQKAALAAIPTDVQLTPASQASSKVEAFDISLANVNGSRVRGYFAKPKGDGPFPAILTVPGAGVNSASLRGAAGYARRGFLSMNISIHELPNGKPKEFYDGLSKGALRDYRARGREDRKTYYFYRVFLGCVRAVDYLTSRPEWDKKHMLVSGSSQGGALALVTAGLDSRVTALTANVPAMCDHSGLAFGRPSGWPRLVPKGKDGKPDAKVLAVSAYYDAVNFARRIEVPALFGVGFIDGTCPATTVFSAYNVLRGPKQIDLAPLMGHAFSPSYRKLTSRWILEQAGFSK